MRWTDKQRELSSNLALARADESKRLERGRLVRGMRALASTSADTYAEWLEGTRMREAKLRGPANQTLEEEEARAHFVVRSNLRKNELTRTAAATATLAEATRRTEPSSGIYHSSVPRCSSNPSL